MQEIDFIVLLQKRFNGEITARENADLDVWINRSAENAELAKQFQLVWDNSTQPNSRTFDPDLDTAYQQLRMRIRATEKQPARVIPLGSRILRIAAALIFLLAAFWGYQHLVSSTGKPVLELAGNLDSRTINLPDGSRVWLRKQASLEYVIPFDTRERRVFLTGEAYFEVSHRPDQPFVIEAGNGAEIKVLGTRFGVRAVPGEPTTTVLVRDGSVRFSPNVSHEGVVLKAAQKAVWDQESAQIRLSNVSTFNDLSWQTGGLEFVRTPLHEVLRDLEHFYHVSIEMPNPAMRNCLHTAPLTNQSIGEVLEGLSLTYQFEVTRKGAESYVLAGGICQ
ncbi:MAG: DUF4974 domain-containing protein [Bacteroidetes bacterium]|nr:MAG: DUF4974 domain-containing protein [Bacteroidota bacterium]